MTTRTFATTLVFIATFWGAVSARSEALAQVSPHHRYTYAWLLTNSDAQSIRVGARALLNDGAVTLEFADIVARILTDDSAGTRASLDVDTVRWLVRVLAASHSQRYLQVLQSLAQKPGRLGADASAAVAALTDAGAAFSAEDVNLPAIRSRLHVLRAESKKVEGGRLAETRDGICLSEATERLGYPDEILVAERPRGVTHGAVVSLQDVMFEYAETGIIEFARSASDWCAVTVSIWEPSFGSMGDSMRSYFIRGFLSNNPTFLRAATRRGYQVKLSDEAQLDIAAFRLRRDMKTSDPALQDALEWISHLLRLSRNPRYFELMQVLRTEGGTKDLRKHGVEGMEELAPASGS